MKAVRATIRRVGGELFEAEIAKLTPERAILRAEGGPVIFAGEYLAIDLLGISLLAEVVSLSDPPGSITVSFRAPGDVKLVIEKLEGHSAPEHAGRVRLRPKSLFEIDARGRLVIASKLEAFGACAMMLAGKSLIARGDRVRAVTLICGSVEMELLPQELGSGFVSLDPASAIELQRLYQQVWRILERAPSFVLESGGALLDPEKNAAHVPDVHAALERRVFQAEQGNHFDVLGVHWACTPKDVERAVRELVEELAHHQTHPDSAVKELAKRLAARVREASAVLMEERSRRRYRERVIAQADREHLANHMLDQAVALIMRLELARAEELVACADEVCSVPRVKEIRGQLQRIRNKG